jgi:uncharacterized OB-fold protein
MAMSELKPYIKPLPSVDYDIKPFWDACKEHTFKLCHCKMCDAWYFPWTSCRNHKIEPRLANMEWAEASGRGKVFTFNIHHVAFNPAFKEDVPYVFALIELDEGPMFGSNIIGCDPYDVTIGMPVEVVFEDITEEYTLPKFRPIKD